MVETRWLPTAGALAQDPQRAIGASITQPPGVWVDDATTLMCPGAMEPDPHLASPVTLHPIRLPESVYADAPILDGQQRVLVNRPAFQHQMLIHRMDQAREGSPWNDLRFRAAYSRLNIPKCTVPVIVPSGFFLFSRKCAS